MNEFRTIGDTSEASVIEKKSKFIGIAAPVSSAEEAAAVLESVRKKHYEASHHVYAYRIVTGAEKYSDDGEPSGSAGLPVMETLRGSELNVTNLITVVTRYFGGTLLGTGGLARCYSQAAKQAVLNAGIVTKAKFTEIETTASYALKAKLEYTFRKEGHMIKDISYGELVTFRLLVRDGAEAALESQVNDIASATAAIARVGEVWL